MADMQNGDTNHFPIDDISKLDKREFKELLHEFWDFSLFHGKATLNIILHLCVRTSHHIITWTAIVSFNALNLWQEPRSYSNSLQELKVI